MLEILLVSERADHSSELWTALGASASGEPASGPPVSGDRGYRLHHAATADEARAVLGTAAAIDVAVIDLGSSPLADVLALCREVRAGHDAPSGAKVVLTALADSLSPDDRARVLDAGIDGLVLRPCAREELLSIVRSLARLRRTELNLLERARRLADMNQRKDEFLAMLGHELRNPLSGITAALALLRVPSPDEARQGRALDVIERQSSALRRLVDDLLDVARVTRGAIELDRSAIDVSEIVAQTVLDLEQQTHRTAARRITFAARGAAWIDGDPARIVQVVANLLDNAIKHTAADGRIDVEVVASGESIEIRVADDGAGIPGDALPRLFEPFYQVAPTIDRRAGGLGVGLALVRQIAELHEGTATAHSAGANAGSTFVVRLPSIAPPSARPRAPVRATALRPVQILYLEDDVDAAWTLKAQLEAWGHSVAHASDGRSGLDLAVQQASAFELALVDIGLPGPDGYEVGRALQQISPRTVLVALTGYGTAEHERRSAQAGFAHHLVKPVDLPSLERLLADVASRDARLP